MSEILNFIEQTDELCMYAVSFNGYALRHVKNKTYKIL